MIKLLFLEKRCHSFSCKKDLFSSCFFYVLRAVIYAQNKTALVRLKQLLHSMKHIIVLLERRRRQAEWENVLSERPCLYFYDVVRAMFDRGRGAWRPLMKHSVPIGKYLSLCPGQRHGHPSGALWLFGSDEPYWSTCSMCMCVGWMYCSMWVRVRETRERGVKALGESERDEREE